MDITLDLLNNTPFQAAEQLLNHLATQTKEVWSRTNSGQEACNVEHLFWELAKDRWIYKRHEGCSFSWKVLTEAGAMREYRYHGGK